ELVDASQQGRPQRRHRARPANYGIGAIDSHVVAGLWICIAGNIRHATFLERLGHAGGVGRLDPSLPTGDCEEIAHSPSSGSAVSSVVPDHFAADAVLAHVQARTT